ncbi:hypothetical protein PYW07_010176 [Mythimna separata]|uniref:Major facilitator superfamily (MFS) profile domain-containing protein n=1 Tax=Mythimna separata TaxID=271217 RepID=A0AAD7YIM6_MYTSE|nr:hypothetical protein PYW07_010176 [Mythimna separata]
MDGVAVAVNTSIKKQFLIAGCLYLGQFLVGYCTGWVAPVLAKLQNEEETPLESVINDAQSSWIVSVMALGAIVCPYFSGYLCNVIGRKPCLYIGGHILLLAYVILACTTRLYMIFVGRILGGVASGIIFVINLVYIGEMASTRIRGKKDEAMANLISLGRQDYIDEIVAKANEKPKSNMAQLTEMYTGTLGIYFYLLHTDHPAADNLQWMALVSIMCYFLTYFSGFGIIPNTFIGEMFTDTCRGFGGTFAVTIGWVSGFGIQTAFGYMLPALGPHVTFWIFAGLCALAFVFSLLFVPETKGKSLLEIQAYLERRSIF